MAKPIGTRMNDEEWQRHQSSSQWRLRHGFGATWKKKQERKIEDAYNKAVETAKTRYHNALAKAGIAKVNALDELSERECDRVNKDITEVAVELGIWKEG